LKKKSVVSYCTPEKKSQHSNLKAGLNKILEHLYTHYFNIFGAFVFTL